MADQPKLTDDLELPPGVVVTPGHEVPESRPKTLHSDRKIDADGQVVDPGESEFGSTYSKPESGSLSRVAPDRKASTPEAPAQS